MASSTLDAAGIRRALEIRDLSDPAHGPHALQLILDAVEKGLRAVWRIPVQRHRHHPVVSVADNYDRLGYPPDGAARDARYTRYLNDRTVLRTMTSVMIPAVLGRLAGDPPADVLLSCPGLVYRRDAIDRQHVGEPHQVDLWRIRAAGNRFGNADLREMIEQVLKAALPDHRYRVVSATHPYTTDGLEIEVEHRGSWLEVGECGLAHPDVLARSGYPSSASGLAMGLGLDRLVMLRKGLDDIRLLRSSDPRITAQMLDLERYRPVSSMPPVRRDLSIAVARDLTPEELGDRVRSALGAQASAVEQITILSETAKQDLPPTARARLGIRSGQKNVLIRLVLRDLDRTLSSAEANALRDRIYGALHEGTAHVWAQGPPVA